jgi:hypothetical protein
VVGALIAPDPARTHARMHARLQSIIITGIAFSFALQSVLQL